MTMASELARYGLSVRIVDKALARTDKSKALVVWSRTLELLERCGCAARFIETGHKVSGAHIMAGGKSLAHLDVTNVDTPYPYALMIAQSETERLLEEHLNSLGVTVERGVEMFGMGTDITTVKALLRHPDGGEESVETPWLLACDGAHSYVRTSLGIGFEGETLMSDWFLADIHLSGAPIADSEISLYWHEDGILAIFPITGDRFRVIADYGASKGAHPTEPTLEQVQQVLTRRTETALIASDPVWLSGFRINDRKVADYRAGRIFLSGDAAHIHSPAGGQGMNTGMQDAFNLAWKLALVHNKVCHPKLLESYSIERSAVGNRVLEQAGMLTNLAVMKNHAAQVIRNLIGGVLLGLEPVQRAMADTMTEVSIGYPHSPLNGIHDHGPEGPEPGRRLRPIEGQQPVGSGSKPLFALFAEANESTRELLHEFGELLETECRPPIDPHGIWLVRPDGYVACVAKAERIEEISRYLASLTTA